MPIPFVYGLSRKGLHMGQIANQMLLELLIKIRDKLKGVQQPEQGEYYAQNSSHRTEHKGNEN